MDEIDENQVISIRISTELLRRIEQDAKNEHRNRTGQIIHIISTYYEMKSKMI